jgi:nicotinamide-nucleotide amidase
MISGTQPFGKTACRTADRRFRTACFQEIKLIEIITIGDELLCGRTQDSNAAMIARELHAAGFTVERFTTTGDRLEAIRASLLCCLPETRFVIVTGGLGPTKDDLTAEAAACAFDDTLALRPEALTMLQSWLERRGRTMNPSQQKQAMLPSSATVIENPVGTACGFMMRFKERHYLFLPGVPAEARAMTMQSVLSYINQHTGSNHIIRSTTLRIYGLWESLIQEKITDVMDPYPDVSLGFYPHFPEVSLKLTVHGTDESVLNERLGRAQNALSEAIGDYIYGTGDCTLPEAIGRLLLARSQTVAVAESCTGGLLSHLFTTVPGSSAWFERGLVVYSNLSKTELAGVEESVLIEHGAVSVQTARALAEGVRLGAKSIWGISITGIAGPDGGTPEKPVGTVFFAVAGPEGCQTFHRRFTGTRSQNKHLSAYTALDLLRRTLLGLN